MRLTRANFLVFEMQKSVLQILVLDRLRRIIAANCAHVSCLLDHHVCWTCKTLKQRHRCAQLVGRFSHVHASSKIGYLRAEVGRLGAFCTAGRSCLHVTAHLRQYIRLNQARARWGANASKGARKLLLLGVGVHHSGLYNICHGAVCYISYVWSWDLETG